MPAIHLRLLPGLLSRTQNLLILLPLILLPLPVSATASAPAIAKQAPHAVQQAVLSFLQTQSIGLPGEVEITPGPVDARHLSFSVSACACRSVPVGAVGVSAIGVTGIAAVTFMALGLAIVTSIVDRRFSSQMRELESSGSTAG